MWMLVVTLVSLGAAPASDRQQQIPTPSTFSSEYNCNQAKAAILSTLKSFGVTHRTTGRRQDQQAIVAECRPTTPAERLTPVSARRRT